MPSESVRQPRLISVEIDDRTVLKRSPAIDREMRVAMDDLHADSYFAPHSAEAQGWPGPYRLRMRIADGRLALDLSTPEGEPLETVLLAISPFSRTIREYFAICESYFTALRKGASQIEAIDMGRRGIHNDAATQLQERLAHKVDIDHATARRLFTLICVLHLRG